MKKYSLLATIFVLSILLIGCGEGGKTSGTGTQGEPGAPTGTETPTETASSGKEILNIIAFPFSMEESEYSDEGEEPDMGQVNIPIEALSEIQEKSYEGEEELKAFADYIEGEFGIKLDNRWSVTSHFYDQEQTCGMLQFKYWIGSIQTNKSILFNIDNRVANMVLTGCLDGSVDEDNLTKRMQLFEEKYEQEKRELEKNEKFLNETVNYTYYYHTNKLKYTYNLFFFNEIGVINNEYGTECYIDEDGNAVDIRR